MKKISTNVLSVAAKHGALTICMLGYFPCSVSVCCPFFKTEFFGYIIRVSNGLGPDQDRHNVGPDLGPKSLERLSADQNSRR